MAPDQVKAPLGCAEPAAQKVIERIKVAPPIDVGDQLARDLVTEPVEIVKPRPVDLIGGHGGVSSGFSMNSDEEFAV